MHPPQADNWAGGRLFVGHARGQTHVQLIHIIAIRIDLLFPSKLLIILQSYDLTLTRYRIPARTRMKDHVREFLTAIFFFVFLNEVVNETKEANEYEKACPPGRGAAHYYLGSGVLLVPAGADQGHQQDHCARQYARNGDSVGVIRLAGHRREVAGRYVDDVDTAWTFS